MKRTKIIIFISIILIFIFYNIIPLYATTLDDIIEEQKKVYDLEYLEDQVPDSADEAARDLDEPLTIENVAGFLKPEKIFSYIINIIIKIAKDKGSIILKLGAILAVVYVTGSLSETYASNGILKIISYISLVISSLILFESIFNTSKTLISSLNDISSFMQSLIPIMAALLGASGNPASGAVGGLVLFTAIEVFSVIINSFIIPCTNMYLSLGVGAGLTGNINLKGISAFLRNAAVICITFILTIFIGIMSLQKVLAMSGDSLTKRALKFAAGSFIPVAGGPIGEGLETVFACAGSLKSSAGVFGLIIIFLIVLAPILEIFFQWFILDIAVNLSNFFNNSILSSFFSITRDVFAILLTLALGYSVMLFLMLTLMTMIGS
ncbi:MAG: Sporulation stage protein [Clostridia bacterium]|nr:Sporulation stage protein [Clostridia bacterium]